MKHLEYQEYVPGFPDVRESHECDALIPNRRWSMKRMMFAMIFVVLLLSSVTGSFGQDAKKEQPAVPRSGFRAEYLKQLEDVESKMMALGTLFPQKKYSWRPMQGVRSASEVFVHVAASNYLFPQFAGFKPSVTLDRDPEKTITRKANVLELLKESFAFMRQCILDVPDADLDRKMKMFGEETTVRGIFFGAAVHMHEHLGQMIAYARTNRLVPPWTTAETKAK
jgi:uncharacterized damage-inducible protein DinB